MKNREQEIAAACEDAARRAVTDFGETILKWWPAALAAGLRDQLSGSAKSAVANGVAGALSAELLGANVFDADKVAWTVPGPPATSVTCAGGLSEFATAGQAAAAHRSFSVQTSFPISIPPYRDLAAGVNVMVQASGALPSGDSPVQPKIVVRFTLNLSWAWQHD